MQNPVLVIIPTYNEAENISLIIPAVLDAYPYEVLVVDDNSPDGTSDLVRVLQTKYPEKLHLLQRSGKTGLGTAYVAGFRWALHRSYQFICQMDADFSHNPADLGRLVNECQNRADVVVGSRYSRGVNVVNWPLGRILLSFSASYFVRLVTGMPVKDPTAGFNVFTREVLETISLDRIRFVGYAFQIEMKFRAYKRNFRIQEIPIIFTDRVRGKSKMSFDIFNEALTGVLWLRWQSIWKRL